MTDRERTLQGESLSACNDAHDFEAITGFKLPCRELGRSHGFVVVFHNNTAR